MGVTLWQRVVQANKPGPPEHSVSFRTASAASVIIAVAACWSQGELTATVAVLAAAATIIGNVLSYWRREQPWPPVKPILAACAIGGFVWFIATVSQTATPGDISTVEAPLAVLFAWVLCTHAFDVPARRDVAYTLAGSAALMAVAAAQSVDLTLGIYVVLWLAFGVWGLVAMWQSMAGIGGVPWLTLGVAGMVVLVVAGLLVALLPAPRVSTSLIFPSLSPNSSPVDSPSNLTDGSASLPAHAATSRSRIGVGGFLGFANSLDTGVRATLGNQVVMRVRASRPNFWVGQTYDTWNGQSWVESADPTTGPRLNKLDSGSPFDLPPTEDQLGDQYSGGTDVQTYYLAQSGPNLVFHADNAQRVYIQSRSLFLTGDGTIVSSTSMGAGTVYTVVSGDNAATAQQLRAATEGPSPTMPAVPTLITSQAAQYTQLPHPYTRVAELARHITAGIGSPGSPDSFTYDKVEAIEAWMSSHIEYTTDIPPWPPARTPSTPSSSAPAAVSASRSPPPPWSCCDRSGSTPGRRSVTCPAPTIRSPTSTRCRPRTPTPGCRCGSRVTGGRTSIPPRWSHWPTRRRDRCWPPVPATHWPGSRGFPSPSSWRWWEQSSSSVVVACAGRRPGPTRSPPTSSGVGSAWIASAGSTSPCPPSDSDWPAPTPAMASS